MASTVDREYSESDFPSAGPARFWSVDLHVHTPASADVIADRYGASTPDEVVQAALDADLDAIAITDHNSAEWVERMAVAAQDSDLTVLPSVEISTTEGHLLGIWDEGTPESVIQDVLTSLGIPRKDQGKLEVSTKVGFADAAREIEKEGGVAIAAHVDRERGLMKLTVAAHRNQTLQTSELAALEVVDLDDIGQVKNKVDPIRPGMAYVRSSDVMAPGGDSHEIGAMGARRTWIKASKPDLIGLRHALADPELRVRLEAPPEATHSQILSLKVAGGFFDGIEFEFASDLNCLMGGTGTGKSLAIELIRFALDQQTDGDRFGNVREEVDSRLIDALGTDSTVELVIRRSDGSRVTIRRTFDAGGSPSPEIVSGMEPGTDIPEAFPIRAFSQSEIIEFAREPVGRLGLVDSAIDLSEIDDELEHIEKQLTSNGNEVCKLQAEVAKLEESLAGLSGLKERVDELSGLFEAEAVKAQADWAKEELRFSQIESALDERDSVRIESTAKFGYSVAVKNNTDLYKRAKACVKQYRDALKEIDEQIAQIYEQASDELGSIATEWSARFREFDDQLSTEIAKIDDGDQDLEALRTRLKQLQKQQTQLEEDERKLKEVMQPRLEELLDERESLLDALVKVRTKRRKLRRDRIKKLNRAMAGSVRLGLLEDVDDSEFAAKLSELARGSGFQKKHLSSVVATASPVKLVRSFLEGNAEAVAKATGVPVSRIEVLFDHIESSGVADEFVELQTLEISDGLAVEFRKSETQEYVEIERLAHGQKCTAILVLALAETNEPLIVDQPEDALHAPWIEEHLVSRLRDLRGSRQYIFATRSPGIVVSADAEMITALDSEKQHGEVVAAGSLERHDLNKQALYHLEGGSKPFNRRAGKLSASL